jgi:hypothetical protein
MSDWNLRDELRGVTRGGIRHYLILELSTSPPAPVKTLKNIQYIINKNI